MQAQAVARLQYFKFTSDAFPPIVEAVKTLYKAYRAVTKRILERSASEFDKEKLEMMDQEDLDKPPLQLPKWAVLRDIQKVSDSKRKPAHDSQEKQQISKKQRVEVLGMRS